MLLRHLFEAKIPDADAAFAFGRFNPAHQGHIEVYKAVQAAGKQWFIGTNPNTHGPNDPLTFEEKAAWMQAIYPPIKGHILPEQSVVTLASKLYEMLGDGKTIAYVTDSNDWAWAGKLLNDYNGKEGPHGYYKFAAIRHIESPRVSSATALRNAARAGDEQAFYAASGTNPKLTVNGKTYFDTVVAATSANPEKPKKIVKKKKEPEVAEGNLEEYGDTKKGQKMLTKVHKRAVDRMIKADDKRDAKDAKKNQQTANRAWDRMADVYEEKQKGVDGKACWDGYKRMGTKKKGGKTVDNCVKVGESESKAMAQTAKRLTDPKDGAVAKLRAAGDKRREDQLKSRNIAKKNESVDLKTSLQELSNDMLGKYKKAASADASKADKEGNFKRGDKRFSGIVKATKKQFDNDAKGKQ